MIDLEATRDDAIRSSGGGVGFLIRFGSTMCIVRVFGFTAPVNVAAMAFLVQDHGALPLAISGGHFLPYTWRSEPCANAPARWRWIRG